MPILLEIKSMNKFLQYVESCDSKTMARMLRYVSARIIAKIEEVNKNEKLAGENNTETSG